LRGVWEVGPGFAGTKRPREVLQHGRLVGDPRAAELEPSELVKGAAEMGSQPQRPVQPTFAVDAPIHGQVAAQVGKGSPGDIVGDVALPMPTADVGDRGQEDIGIEEPARRTEVPWKGGP